MLEQAINRERRRYQFPGLNLMHAQVRLLVLAARFEGEKISVAPGQEAQVLLGHGRVSSQKSG